MSLRRIRAGHGGSECGILALIDVQQRSCECGLCSWNHIHLLDDKGQEVRDPFLPLDAEFWNDDRTRYTVFFDPGRQKRGIAPIADMGRSLTHGP